MKTAFQIVNIPLLLITISISSGIALENYFDLPTREIVIFTFLFYLILLVLWYYNKKPFTSTSPFKIATIITFIAMGSLLHVLKNPVKQKNHYLNNFDLNNDNKWVTVQFEINQKQKSSTYNDRYKVSLIAIDGKNTTGYSLLQIPLHCPIIDFSYGDILIANVQFKKVTPPLNPGAFDYQNYLKHNGIYHSIKADCTQILKSSYTSNNIFRWSGQIRNYLKEALRNTPIQKENLGIIFALLLGEKSEIDPELLNNYQNSGAVHLLAISGLHIGILLYVLQFCFSFLDKVGRFGKLVKTFFCIAGLWGFALIAGLSPSVVRAVTMFSFLTIGLLFRNRTSSYNTLLLSFLFLVCIQPNWLFHVGFQLSYLAVFGILWIQPSIYSFYKPKFKMDKIVWDTATVTLAAQIVITPLSLYYFHQFPLLFLFSNLLVVPFLGFILTFGIGFIILLLLQIAPVELAIIFNNIIQFLNDTVTWFSSFENFIIKNIYFPTEVLCFTYLGIFTLIFALLTKRKSVVYISLVSFMALVSIVFFTKVEEKRKQRLIVFHQNRKCIIGIHENYELKLLSNSPLSWSSNTYLITNYLNNSLLKTVKFDTLQNVFLFKDKQIVIIDSTGIYSNLPKTNDKIVILSHNPKIHLARMIDSLQPDLIIADGSNYRSNLNRWQTTCKNNSIPLYRTDHKGAFITE